MSQNDEAPKRIQISLHPLQQEILTALRHRLSDNDKEALKISHEALSQKRTQGRNMAVGIDTYLLNHIIACGLLTMAKDRGLLEQSIHATSPIIEPNESWPNKDQPTHQTLLDEAEYPVQVLEIVSLVLDTINENIARTPTAATPTRRTDDIKRRYMDTMLRGDNGLLSAIKRIADIYTSSDTP